MHDSQTYVIVLDMIMITFVIGALLVVCWIVGISDSAKYCNKINPINKVKSNSDFQCLRSIFYIVYLHIKQLFISQYSSRKRHRTIILFCR